MRKLAIFVEGQTERIFVKAYVKAIFEDCQLLVEEEIDNDQITILRAQVHNGGSEEPVYSHYVLISDCGSDERVLTRIIEEHRGLMKESYAQILGLRDVYPKRHSEIPGLKAEAKKRLPAASTIIFAVMEIEAWFLAEYSHFVCLHANLDLPRIKAIARIDPRVDDVEQVRHPAHCLKTIYKSVGFDYRKSAIEVTATVSCLNMQFMWTELVDKISSLKDLTLTLRSFAVSGESRP